MAKIHPLTAQLDQLMRKINTIGKLPLWALMTLHTSAVCSSWTSTSQLTTHSSLQSWTSQLVSIIQTSTPMAQFAWIFSKSNGHQHSPSPRFCFQSAPCWQIPIQMIHWFQKLPTSTRLIRQNTKLLPENGLENMQCDHQKADETPTSWVETLSIWLLYLVRKYATDKMKAATSILYFPTAIQNTSPSTSLNTVLRTCSLSTVLEKDIPCSLVQSDEIMKISTNFFSLWNWVIFVQPPY